MHPKSTLFVLMLAAAAGLQANAAPATEKSPVFKAGPEVPVTAQSKASPMGNNSPVLAIDPTEQRFLALAARIDGPDYGCTLHLSGDGGNTWVPADPFKELPPGADKCYAPSVAFDRKGTLFVLFAGLADVSNSPTGIFLAASEDRGRTFSVPRRIAGPFSYMAQMAMDRDHGPKGRIWVAWVRPGVEPAVAGFTEADNPIVAAFSDDAGRTFSRPARVSDKSRPRSVRPALAAGSEGRLHVVYFDLKEDRRDYQGLEGPVWEGEWELVSTRSDRSGGSFERGVVVDEMAPPERILLIFNAPPPALVVDGKGNVHAGWWDARNQDWDVFTGSSFDSGRSWRKPVRVNDDPRGNGRHQYLPNLSMAPGGRLDAVFYDRRQDPANLANHLYFASSHNDGRSFSPNVRLTERPSDSRIGATYTLVPSSRGLHELGSRPALLSAPGGLFAAWTDTSSSGLGEPPAQQNILAAKAGSFPGPEPTSSNLSLPVALAAVLLPLAAVGAFAVRKGWRKERSPGRSRPR